MNNKTKELFSKFMNTTIRSKVVMSVGCHSPNESEPSSYRSVMIRDKCKVWKILAVGLFISAICILKDQLSE